MSSTITNALRQPIAIALDIAQRQQTEQVLRQLPEAAGSARAPEPDAVLDSVQRINEVMRPYGVQFEMGGEPPRVVTRIVDSASGEVIRQIPSEEVLRIAQRLEELVGRLIALEI